MKMRWVTRTVGVGACTSSVVLFIACAAGPSPVSPELEGGPSEAAIPDVLDASGSDGADAQPDLCTPDALCPTGPFDPSTAGGALDPRTRVTVIRGRSENDVWVAGAHGGLAHFDGTSWARSDLGSIEGLNAIWLRDSSEIAMSELTSVYTRGIPIPDAGVAGLGQPCEAGSPPDAGCRMLPSPSDGGWVAVGAPPAPIEVLLAADGANAQLLTSSWGAAGAEWAWCTARGAAPNSVFGPNPHPAPGLYRMRVSPTTSWLEIVDSLPQGACATLQCWEMTGIHGSSADDLWAVGYTGSTVHITGAQGDSPGITVFDSQTLVALYGVWAASADDVWAVGGNGVIRHYTGQPHSWDIVSDVPTTETLRAVWGSSHSDIWAVGDQATVLHYDGTHWTQVHVAGLGLRRSDLFAVWTAAAGHVWIGGDGVVLSIGGKP